MNLLTDPRFQVGGKFRLQQAISRGADPTEAEAIFRKLLDLDPQRWVAEWTRLAEPLEHNASQLEKKGDTQGATKAYKQASLYYSIAKFPVPSHPTKQAAYQKCIETYLKAAPHLDPPVERVAIPFEGKEIIGYLRKPKGVSKPPVVIATGGIDVYNEDRDTTDFLNAGQAAFSMDMPGAGQSPLWYVPGSERLYTAAMEYLLTRGDLDGKRVAVFGRSYGGYWAAKMAFLESKRLRACVDWGGPAHYTFQEPWLRHSLDDKLYLWKITDSEIYAHHVKDFDELLLKAPAMSLQTEGLLEKPCAPLLNVNGVKDPWITIEDSYLLMNTGEPKSIRLYPNGGHMGGDPATGPMIANWLKSHLA
jgi:dienelactone hydrolase